MLHDCVINLCYVVHEQDEVLQFENSTETVITLKVANWIGLETAVFQRLVIDVTPPNTGQFLLL